MSIEEQIDNAIRDCAISAEPGIRRDQVWWRRLLRRLRRSGS